MKRRDLLKLAGALAAPRLHAAETVPLFDGKTLEGWIQVENSATTLTAAAVANGPAFLAKITGGDDPVSKFLRSKVTDTSTLSNAVKQINLVLAGPSIYDKARFGAVVLRPETADLLKSDPHAYALAHLNKLLLEDAYPADIQKSATSGWTVKDGAMASTGAGRGVIYTARDFTRFKLKFTVRHVSGNPDHQACVLIFCTRPASGEKPLDALAGIQFQPPNGGHWDYRAGMNSNGGAEFTYVNRVRYDPHQWSRVEIVADAHQGTASMSVAQPVGESLVEVVQFKDPGAGKTGPLAWQMHNAGLFDEYRDVAVEM
jgi:hypothetical protein